MTLKPDKIKYKKKKRKLQISIPHEYRFKILSNRIQQDKRIRGRCQDGGGVGRGKHFLPHKFIKRAFKRRVNSTKQLLNAGRGHQAPRKAVQLLERR